ncbi:DNA-processing protein DprA [Pseudoramibacter sp.]|jgi:DNA processing protein|uniref:DNA-processing protein DprA n=1 Tax=Pseudoramibacter sp. TaxID=2034862 RepID=UPI0025D3DAB0|nr:DNA-processing protein DprA [Pseudoramibacter sp.]MCH4072647.1 DNA-processing protein DprA [Pseudoramibacter sp.]MCH4106418.1 DNA-processing protein DprA [Pseudoramibacter sp.]
MQDDLIYDLWLSSVTNVSNMKKNTLLSVFKTAEAIYKASPEAIRKTGFFREKDIQKIQDQKDTNLAERAFVFIQKNQIVCIPKGSPSYPSRLEKIYNPPVLLYAMGNTGLLKRDLAIGMVGSRKSSADAVAIAKKFSQTLSEMGVTVVSGMANGIDSASAEGALAGIGSTIAVLGSGIDVCYPANQRDLYNDIREKGLLLSEFFIGQPPKAGHFPMRNRIIAGLSDGLVVVEARMKSGALITADHALDQGKTVYAIPQSINVKSAEGSNQLLKEGAKLVTTAEDILEDFVDIEQKRKELEKNTAISADRKPERQAEKLMLSEDEQAVMTAVEGGIDTVDGLVQHLDQPISKLNAVLMMLEIKKILKVNYGQITLLRV